MVFFNIILHDGRYKCELAKEKPRCGNHRFLEKITGCDSMNKENAGRLYTKDVVPSDVVYLVKEFQLLERFYRKVYRFLSRLDGTVQFSVLEPVNGGLVDHHWCRRALRLSWEKVDVDNLMSWLSTLGGAFSALGDYFDQAAERAGRISFYQMALAMRSGDPSIIARCKLYHSISLIQKERFREAKQIILDQYDFAKNELKAGDPRIYKMCHGIWLKLQHHHQVKREKKKNARKIEQTNK